MEEKTSSSYSEYEEIQQQLKGLYAKKTSVYQHPKKDVSTLQAIHSEEESLLLNEQNNAAIVETCKLGERESFEALSDAIQDSHQKERAQSDQMKYYTRIGSLLGAFFGFLGSNFFIKREMRKHNLDQLKRFSQFEEELAASTTQNQSIMTTVENIQEHVVQVSQSVCNMNAKLDAHNKVLTTEARDEVTRNKPCTVTSESIPPPNLNPVPEQSGNTELVAVVSVISYSFLLTLLALL